MDSKYDIVGSVNEIYPEQQMTEKFRKREFILETSGQYPEFIKLQLVQEKCALIDQFKVGDLVKVDFNLRGRVFVKDNIKSCFTNLEAWRIMAEAPATAPVDKSKPNSQI
jgi:single-strand DNA-binding protein